MVGGGDHTFITIVGGVVAVVVVFSSIQAGELVLLLTA